MSENNQELIRQLQTQVEQLTQTLNRVELEHASERSQLLDDIQHNMQDKLLMIDTTQQLAAAKEVKSVYAALTGGVMNAGASRSVLYTFHDLDRENIPIEGKISFIDDTRKETKTVGLDSSFLIKDYPTFKKMIKEQEMLIIKDVSTDERLNNTERKLLSGSGSVSIALNLLTTRMKVVGMISIEYRTPYEFTERELSLYYTLGNQATIAIENARQAQRTKVALAETQTLYRAGRVLAGMTSLQEILEEALIEFLYSLGLDQGGITLLTRDRNYGQLMAYVQNGIPQEVETLRFSISEKIAYQQILISGQPFISTDVPNDPRLVDFQSFNLEESPKSLLEAPLIIHGDTIGWVGADSVKEYREFSQREIDLSRAMADQIAVAIQNRRLLEQTERRAKELEAVSHIGQSVSQLIDLKDILDNTVNLIKDLFDFYHVSIFLLDETKEWAIVKASTGEVGKIMVARPHSLQVGSNSIVGYATEHAKPRIALDVGADATHFNNPLLPDTRSEMALPLISRGTVIGAMDVQSIKPHAFDDDDIEILQIMVNQLTAAIENAKLFAEQKIRESERERLIKNTQKNLSRAQTLYRISHILTTATTTPQFKFDTVLGEYLQLLNLNNGKLMLIDASTNMNEAKAKYANGLSAETCFCMPVQQDTIIKHFEDDPEPLIIKNAHSHYLLKDNPLLETLSDIAETTDGSNHYLLFIPIIARDDIIGYIMIESATQERAFSQDDVEIGEATADQLAIWLENRRLLEEAQHSSRLLQTAAEVSRVASSILDVDELTNASVNLIRDRFDFYYVGLFIVDKARKWAVLRAGTGEAGRAQIQKVHRLEIGGGSMIGWSIQNQKARITLDIGQDAVQFKNPFLPDTHSELALPLTSRDEVIGALTVQSVERGAFSDEDVTLLQTMADQLANALTNARLFANVALAQKEAENSLKETQALQQLSQNLAGTLKVEDITNIFFHACTTFLGFDFIIFYIVDNKNRRVKAMTGIGVTDSYLKQANHPLDSDNVRADIIRSGKTRVVTGYGQQYELTNYETESHTSRGMRLFTPVIFQQKNIGLVETGFNRIGKSISKQQIRILRAFIDQVALALDNAQHYEATQRSAQREEIIRDITSKIRGSISIDDILTTTLTELGKVLNSSRGTVRLGLISKTVATINPDKSTNGDGVLE